MSPPFLFVIFVWPFSMAYTFKPAPTLADRRTQYQPTGSPPASTAELHPPPSAATHDTKCTAISNPTCLQNDAVVPQLRWGVLPCPGVGGGRNKPAVSCQLPAANGCWPRIPRCGSLSSLSWASSIGSIGNKLANDPKSPPFRVIQLSSYPGKPSSFIEVSDGWTLAEDEESRSLHHLSS